MPKPALSYCAEQACRQDHERYVTVLFAPVDRREDLFALYAFNLEIAKTAELVSEDLLGRMRLQWWRECLDEVYAGQTRHHAVVEPLAAAVHRHGLARAHFDRLIDAREGDLAAEPPADLAALEDYAAGTAAGLVHLGLQILGVAADSTGAIEAGRRLGLAWALTGLARAVPFHARQRRLYLPADMAAQAGLDIGGLFELRGSEALSQVIAQLAARAGEHLAAARALRGDLPHAAFSAMLLGPLAERHLKILSRAGFDPFDSRVQVPPSGSAWRLAWAALKRRY
jgi:phytoene synthase